MTPAPIGLSILSGSHFSTTPFNISGVFCAEWRERYHFRPASLFRLATFTADGSLGRLTIMLGFDVSIEGRIGEIAKLTSSADILPALLIFPGLPHFFLLLIGLALCLDVILNHVIVDHVLLLLRLCLTHHLLLVALTDRQKILRLLLVVVVNRFLPLHAVHRRVYKGHINYADSLTHIQSSVFERAVQI